MKKRIKLLILAFTTLALCFLPCLQAEDAPAQQQAAVIYLDSYMGKANYRFAVNVGDLLNIKSDQLKFRLAGKTIDYSGHYAIWIMKARKHSNPYFGFGTPEKAKFVNIHCSGFKTFLMNATIWEKDPSFIDAEANGQEVICSGSFEVEN